MAFKDFVIKIHSKHSTELDYCLIYCDINFFHVLNLDVRFQQN